MTHPCRIPTKECGDAARNGRFSKLVRDISTIGIDQSGLAALVAKIVLKAQNYSAAMIGHLIAKTRMLDRLRGQLNMHQEKALIRMYNAGPGGFTGGLSAKNYMMITDTAPATSRRHLGNLVAKGALVRNGMHYWLRTV